MDNQVPVDPSETLGHILYNNIGNAMDALQKFEAPFLISVTEQDPDSDDPEDTVTYLRCPVCGEKVDMDDDLFALDYAERWDPVQIEPEDKQLRNDWEDHADASETVAFMHGACENPVRFPSDWTYHA